jgi:hypothetical protein
MDPAESADPARAARRDGSEDGAEPLSELAIRLRALGVTRRMLT